jgi:hypothetical protein
MLRGNCDVVRHKSNKCDAQKKMGCNKTHSWLHQFAKSFCETLGRPLQRTGGMPFQRQAVSTLASATVLLCNEVRIDSGSMICKDTNAEGESETGHHCIVWMELDTRAFWL